MKEREFQAQVVELARAQNWIVYHTADSRRSNPGWPDLVLVRGPIMLCLELKTAKGRISASQMAWIEALKKVRIVHADIARPANWPDIERALTSRAR